MQRRSKIYLALSFAFVAALYFFPQNAFSSSVNVDLTIPSFGSGGGGGGGGGGGPTPTDNFPVISNVTVTSTETTASIAWSATDDIGISSVQFDYGTTLEYGNNVFAGANSVNLSGLTSGITYYYRIRVTDTGSQLTVYTGSFTTLVVDSIAPFLSSIIVTPGINSAVVSWTANEASDGRVNYGSTTAYGQVATDAAFSTSHSITLPSLLQNSHYDLQIIATDGFGNSTSTQNITFTTLPDSTPPPNVTGLVAIGSSYPTLAWTNPNVPDLSRVIVVRKIGSFSTSTTDGLELYNGNLETYTDFAVSSTPHYYYTVFSVDTSNNYSSGIYVQWHRPLPPAEVCTNGLDDDGNGLTDCADPACSTNLLCLPPVVNEVCNNHIDDDGNSLIDCADPACLLNAACMIQVVPTTTPPGGDQSGSSTTTVTTTVPIITTTTTPTPTSTVPEFGKLSLSDLKFFTGNRQIEVHPSGNQVSVLSGANFTVQIGASALPSVPRSVVLTVGGTQDNIFRLDGNTYVVDIVFPNGNAPAYVKIDYGNEQVDVLTLRLAGVSKGEVKSGEKLVDGAEVTLYVDSGSAFPAISYGAGNPVIAKNGQYGWVVPNGKYYLTAKKNGYRERKTPVFQVNNNVVNIPVSLIQLPPPIELNLNSIAQNAGVVAKVGLQTISDAAATVVELKKNETVQNVASNVVAPVSVSAITVGTAVMVPDKIFSFFQLVFFQPVLLLNRKKRKAWGQVYNAFNKLPIDLAIVRLINADNGRVVQSKVTDSKGKYAFMAKPGNYAVQVIKNNFIFPSEVLKNEKSDGSKADIYHGEIITVNEENAVITANIPLDPMGHDAKPSKIYLQQVARKLQLLMAWSGFVLTLVSLYFSPRWYVWLMLLVHLLLIIIFYRLALPPKIKSWGIVYDENTRHPVGRVIARLYNMQFNKLVGTQITDGKGRYYFLAGDNNYYITYEHPSFVTKKTDPIDLSGKESESIALDVGLSKYE